MSRNVFFVSVGIAVFVIGNLKFSSGAEDPHAVENALQQLDVHADFELKLFAAEPMLMSPSNIDIDHRGRVWVCEVLNYRKRNRAAGDRILILEDTDGDGQADTTQVFYQGSDIDSPHGICVIGTPSGRGNQVIVSVGDRVVVFTDVDGDDRADQQENLFTGISGVQHDHGIHAVVYGPDSRLYFNFGNRAGQLMDKTGQPVVDSAGNQVASHRQPYQQGMVFRCLPDGSQVETLGWNFRNNWEVTVDSFGNIWQSDNDDDGNRSVRINFVMEFGNYGFCDERTGAAWKVERTGWHNETVYRHWHQNDPGVVPNLLHTGAGSPTGITVYEGDLLGPMFQGQIIHCDAGAGPAVCRAYPVTSQGAGYRASIVDLVSGRNNSWYRPSDVSVAPDGSLIIADWYDSAVGGHQMGDAGRGRLYRLAPRGNNTYRTPDYDYQTVDGAIEALQSPNNAARVVASIALRAMGKRAVKSLKQLARHENPRFRARALWTLGQCPGWEHEAVWLAVADEAVELRVMSIRMARCFNQDLMKLMEKLSDDPSPAVRRECAIALRLCPAHQAAALWAKLALQHDATDRWYLEALGIGATDKPDACLNAWLAEVGDGWNNAAGRQIVWRIRSQRSPALLAELIANPSISQYERQKYFRAFDFHDGQQKENALHFLVTSLSLDKGDGNASLPLEKREAAVAEALSRLPEFPLGDVAHVKAAVIRQMRREVGSFRFWDLAAKYQLRELNDKLLELALSQPDETSGVRAAQLLKKFGDITLLWEQVEAEDPVVSVAAVTVLGHLQDASIVERLLMIVQQSQRTLAVRQAACTALGHQLLGRKKMLALVKSQELADELKFTVANILLAAQESEVQAAASKYLSLPQTADRVSLPPLAELVKLPGDADRGKEVFHTVGTCSKCHQVNDQGKAVGPQLSEIGSKLSMKAFYISILDPNAGISHGFEQYSVFLEDGSVINGLLTNETDAAISIKTADAIERKILREQIEEIKKLPISLMPAGLERSMTKQQLVDVVEYMTTLQKKAP